MQEKSQKILNTLLSCDEQVITTGTGTAGLKEAQIALTTRKVVIFRMGATIFSEPRFIEIPLEYITSVNCVPGALGAGPTLTIESRSGDFGVTLTKQTRKQGSMWPHWILRAQGAQSRQSTDADDVATRLTQLAALRESGALTQDEFAAAKARILG